MKISKKRKTRKSNNQKTVIVKKVIKDDFEARTYTLRRSIKKVHTKRATDWAISKSWTK